MLGANTDQRTLEQVLKFAACSNSQVSNNTSNQIKLKICTLFVIDRSSPYWTRPSTLVHAFCMRQRA